ncbi:MAG: phage holin family protein [Bacteroidaceae bacterium]|nr:phage holin family protein [Bacteroidaceae bacterium]
MLFGEKSNESIQQLISEAKTYLDLQKDYIRLEMTEKLTILLSTLILVLIMVVLGMVALFYFSFTLAYVLAPFVGGLMVSFGLITLFLILVILFIYYKRERLIVSPMVNFLAKIFLKESEKEKEDQIVNATINEDDTTNQE